jgi:WD40 repeat protein
MKDQIGLDTPSKNQKFVSTSTDGFIKMWDSYDASAKKSFFVCQAGISALTPIYALDNYALAGLDNNIYLFSFLTSTTINQFYAHDDTITALCFKKVSLKFLLS